MSTSQKVLLRQLQLAGIGIIFLIFGLLKKQVQLCWIGMGVFAFGCARAYFIYQIVKHAEDE